MNEMFKLNKENWRAIVYYTVLIIIGLAIINLFIYTSSVEFQNKLMRLVVFDYESLDFTDSDISKGIMIIGCQILFTLYFIGLLKIIQIKNKQIGQLIVMSAFIILISIILTNVSFPYFIKLAGLNFSNNIGFSSLPGIFFIQNQLIIWIILNVFFAPFLFTFLGLRKKILFSRNLVILFGLVFFIAGIITPPDIVSQLLIGIPLSLFWLIGFGISKLIRRWDLNFTESNNYYLYSLIISVFTIIWLFLLGVGSLSLPESIITISISLLIQNLIIIGKIYKTDKLSSLYSLIIPFYLPYYILKNIRGIFNNELFYKIYSGILIVLTLIMILKLAL